MAGNLETLRSKKDSVIVTMPINPEDVAFWGRAASKEGVVFSIEAIPNEGKDKQLKTLPNGRPDDSSTVIRLEAQQGSKQVASVLEKFKTLKANGSQSNGRH